MNPLCVPQLVTSLTMARAMTDKALTGVYGLSCPKTTKSSRVKSKLLGILSFHQCHLDCSDLHDRQICRVGSLESPGDLLLRFWCVQAVQSIQPARVSASPETKATKHNRQQQAANNGVEQWESQHRHRLYQHRPPANYTSGCSDHDM